MARPRPSVPSWVEPLLSTQFFCFRCPHHVDWPRSERNLFCLDCAASAASFCFNCRHYHHLNHRVVQIRRSSYCDVVKISELQDHMDVSGIQTYTINNDKVVFLNERHQQRPGVAPVTSQSSCDICNRNLHVHYRFCSLRCKLERVKSHRDVKLTLAELDLEEEEEVVAEHDPKENEKAVAEHDPEEKEEVAVEKYALAKRRKGIPRRAPLF